ncbi:AMSH-like protease isoform X1 [Lates japonicus]|uniref:AMSH-like protease isoform X1 n=1 Tax=Lates japonicus TaxID=270547 RepID=A0AAD3RNL1_LATJO|nr:AMSH-like protease isoform X1 [Lates japonicus]
MPLLQVWTPKVPEDRWLRLSQQQPIRDSVRSQGRILTETDCQLPVSQTAAIIGFDSEGGGSEAVVIPRDRTYRFLLLTTPTQPEE